MVFITDQVDHACNPLQDRQSSYAQNGFKINVSKTQYMTNLALTKHNLSYGKQIELCTGSLNTYEHLGHEI